MAPVTGVDGSAEAVSSKTVAAATVLVTLWLPKKLLCL